MMKFSPIETWKHLTCFGRLLVGGLSLLLIACTAVSCFSTAVILIFSVPTPGLCRQRHFDAPAQPAASARFDAFPPQPDPAPHPPG